jgi:hypothetical protein
MNVGGANGVTIVNVGVQAKLAACESGTIAILLGTLTLDGMKSGTGAE